MLVCLAMAGNPSPPDYELADRMALTGSSQVKAISHPLRTTILGLLHERAATVTELAIAVARPKSTVAHHVKVLTAAALHGCSTSVSSGARTATTSLETSTTSRSPLGSRSRRSGTGSCGVSSGT